MFFVGYGKIRRINCGKWWIFEGKYLFGNSFFLRYEGISNYKYFIFLFESSEGIDMI